MGTILPSSWACYKDPMRRLTLRTETAAGAQELSLIPPIVTRCSHGLHASDYSVPSLCLNCSSESLPSPPPVWVWCLSAGLLQHWGSHHQTRAIIGTGHDLWLTCWCLRTLAVPSADTVPWGTLTCVICSMDQMTGHLVIASSLLPKAATPSCPAFPGVHPPHPVSPLTK